MLKNTQKKKKSYFRDNIKFVNNNISKKTFKLKTTTITIVYIAENSNFSSFIGTFFF